MSDNKLLEIFNKYKSEGFVPFCCSHIYTEINKNGTEKKKFTAPNKHQEICLDNCDEYKEGTTLCIGTGKRSNLTVIDFDSVESYEQVVGKYPALREVRTIQTKKGYHMYFNYNPTLKNRSDAFCNLKCVDVRNDGGFVFAAPTTYKMKDGTVCEYKDLGGKMIDVPIFFLEDSSIKKVTKAKKDAALCAEARVEDTDVEDEFLKLFLDAEKQKNKETVMALINDGLLDYKCDNYSDWMQVGLAMKECVDFECFKHFSKRSTKYDEEGIQKLWGHIKGDSSKKLTMGSLMYWARNAPVKETKVPVQEGFITDDEVADYILHENKGSVVNNNGSLYAYFQHSWWENVNYVFEKWISKCELNTNTDTSKRPSLVKSRTKSWESYKKQMYNKCVNELEPSDVLNKENGVLPFLDGVYIFKEQKFVPYEDYGVCYMTYGVRRKFPKNYSKLTEMKRIVTDIFNGEQDRMTEVFQFWARGLAKHVQDKLALLLVGERNSGKGFIIMLLELCFSGVVGNFLSGDLLSKKGSYETAERKNGCLAPMCSNPLCFSQEIDPKAKFDGALWRTIVSGGDEVSFRVSYGKLEVKRIIGSLTFTSNVVISFDQANSGETLLVYNMPCQYREEVPDDNVCRGYTIKQADTSIKERVKQEEYLDAFTLLVLEHYTDKTPRYPELKEASRAINEVEEDMDDGAKLQNSIKKVYEVNPMMDNNKIIRTEVHRALKECDESFTPSKIINVLASMGVKIKKVKGIRYYSGLTLKPQDEN